VLARLWSPVARRTDQLVMPRRATTDREALTGEVVGLDLPGDEGNREKRATRARPAM